MTDRNQKASLVQALERVCADIAAIAALLEGDEPRSEPKAADPAEAKATAPAAQDKPEAPAPGKEFTYEETRAILAEKARAGFRAEVKAILTAHGVKQLSDVKDPLEFATIVAEAESIAMPQT